MSLIYIYKYIRFMSRTEAKKKNNVNIGNGKVVYVSECSRITEL